MANSIESSKIWIPILDKIYKKKSITAFLDGNLEEKNQTKNATEFVVPSLKMSGNANYNRSTGYVGGDVTLTYQTVGSDYDRGRSFVVDYIDDADSANIAFGKLADEFIRTKVVPELDTYRLNKYARRVTAANSFAKNITTGEEALEVLLKMKGVMDNNEVDEEERVLFAVPHLLDLINALDTNKSRAVLDSFGVIQKAPQGRMRTGIRLNDGVTAGQESGGITVLASSKDINFLCIQKAATVQFSKHIAPKIITAQQNQNADAWKFGYRHLAYCDVYNNKINGLTMSMGE